MNIVSFKTDVKQLQYNFLKDINSESKNKKIRELMAGLIFWKRYDLVYIYKWYQILIFS